MTIPPLVKQQKKTKTKLQIICTGIFRNRSVLTDNFIAFFVFASAPILYGAQTILFLFFTIAFSYTPADNYTLPSRQINVRRFSFIKSQ